MAIELITGQPGAGKTCYAVAIRMASQEGATVEYEDQFGIKHETKRRILAGGFKELLIEHHALPHPLTGDAVRKVDIERWNRLDANDDPVLKRVPGDPPVTHELVDGKLIPLEHTIFNWWLWCLPGDLICFDEVQYVIPRGVVGRVPPQYIKALEIHRHYGVDFLLITQHPQLIDMTIRALVNPHRHVRSVSILGKFVSLVLGGVPCALYVWDHASNPERYTTAMKSSFIRKRRYFALYKSTVAVMKQPTASGAVFWIAPLVLLLCFAGGWWTISSFVKSKTAKPPMASSSAGGILSAAVAAPGAPGPVLKPARRRPPGYQDVPELAGCYTIGDRCTCQDRDGRPVAVALEMCRLSARSYDGLVPYERSTSVPPPPRPGEAPHAVGVPSSLKTTPQPGA